MGFYIAYIPKPKILESKSLSPNSLNPQPLNHCSLCLFSYYCSKTVVQGLGVQVGSIPHPVMGTTRDYCRYIKALLTPYYEAITTAGIDLRFRVQISGVLLRACVGYQTSGWGRATLLDHLPHTGPLLGEQYHQRGGSIQTSSPEFCGPSTSK